MPVIFSNPAFPNQQSASQTSQAYNVQLDFGQMLREVCGWNPQVDPDTAGRSINNYYRKFADLRSWYGMKMRGQIVIPNTINQGVATFTSGSQNVTGVGTAWTAALIGQQIRSGFTYPLQTIINVLSPTLLVMDMPFGGQTQISGGYNIFSAYIPMGGNFKRMLWAVNQQQGWPMKVNVPVEALNWRDVWRISIGWSTHMAIRPPTPDGQYQIEVWPTPYQQQVFPFEAYQQPNDMQLDSDAPLAFVRADLLVGRAVADALMYRPKTNPYYDPQTAITVAGAKIKEWNEAVEQAQMADNDTDQQDTSWDYGQEDDGGGGEGSTWNQNHG